MSGAGDVIEHPVTGERAVVRLGTEETGGELLVVEAFVEPGGAVTGGHVHPVIEEYFTVVSGRVGFRLDGRESIARLLGYRGSYPEYLERGPTERVEVEPWTNAV